MGYKQKEMTLRHNALRQTGNCLTMVISGLAQCVVRSFQTGTAHLNHTRTHSGLGQQATDECGHAFGGGLADDFNGTVGGHLHGLGVDEVNGHVGLGIADEPGGGIYLQRGADDDEDVGTGGDFGGGDEVGHGFAKPHNPGTEQRTVGGSFAVGHAQMAGLQGTDARRDCRGWPRSILSSVRHAGE